MSGRTARLVSALRPEVPILAISQRKETVHRLNLLFGVRCALTESWGELRDLLDDSAKIARQEGIAKPGELVPGLAESWSVADDGMTYTFKIKSGITFSSGNPLTAEDAALSLRRVVKLNKTPAFIITQFGLTPENVDQMVTFDGDTVTLKTDKAYAPSFVYNCLTAGVANIVDMKTVMANEVDGVHQ